MGYVGTGTTISFGTTSFVAELLSISGPSASRESIDMSHMGTTKAKVFTPADLVDWGEVTMEIAHAPGAAVHVPIEEAAEEITITYADSGSSTLVFTGHVTGYDPGIPMEERATGTITIKVGARPVPPGT